MARCARTSTVSRAGALLASLVLVLAACGSDRAPAVSADPPAPPGDLRHPNFTDLRDVQVTVDGRTVPLGESGLTYQRRTAPDFDDPATPAHDGIAATIRSYLACEADSWTLGSQTFTVDLVVLGINSGDRALLEKGLVGVDWGAAQTVDEDGTFTLERSCDSTAAEGLGGTHTTTQWLESLGRTVHLLRSTPWADAYEDQITAYISQMEEISRRLVQEDTFRFWEEQWLVNEDGDIYTHKTYMRAAGLGLAAGLTDDRDRAAEWAAAAQAIVARGMAAQHDDGVNPEKGGYDVSYQMYGTWLAQLYLATLAPGPLADELDATIDRAIEWMSTRVDPASGQINVGDSTRTCLDGGRAPYEAPDAVRVFLTWATVHPERTDLIDQAVLIDRGAKGPGNPCP